MTMDLNRSRASKEWLGADVTYLLLFYLQTSMNVSNLGSVPRTARIPKEVMSVPVPKASGLRVTSMENAAQLMVRWVHVGINQLTFREIYADEYNIPESKP